MCACPMTQKPHLFMCPRENILVNKDTWLRLKCIHATKYYATVKMSNLDRHVSTLVNPKHITQMKQAKCKRLHMI